MRSLEKQTARLRNFNSKSFCPSLLLMDLVYLADKPLLLKKIKNKKNQRQQHHRKRNFLSPFDFHSSALRAGLLTAETSRYASEGSVPLLLPPNRLHLPLLPHPQHPSSSQSNSSSSSTPPSPRGWPSLAPKVLQITFLNFRAEPGSDCRKKKKIQVPTEGGRWKFPLQIITTTSLLAYNMSYS